MVGLPTLMTVDAFRLRLAAAEFEEERVAVA
jgi:hypothetical protein